MRTGVKRLNTRAERRWVQLRAGQPIGGALGRRECLRFGPSREQPSHPPNHQSTLSSRRVTLDPIDGLDALALSHHSGARVAGGVETAFSAVPTVSFSPGIGSLRWLLALGRAEAYQHMVPS